MFRYLHPHFVALRTMFVDWQTTRLELVEMKSDAESHHCREIDGEQMQLGIKLSNV